MENIDWLILMRLLISFLFLLFLFAKFWSSYSTRLSGEGLGLWMSVDIRILFLACDSLSCACQNMELGYLLLCVLWYSSLFFRVVFCFSSFWRPSAAKPHKNGHESGPRGSPRAHTRWGRSHALQEAFQTPPRPQSLHKNKKTKQLYQRDPN